MGNYCRSVGFGMQRSKNDMSSISIELVAEYAQSLRILTQSLELWAWSIDKWAHSTEGVHGE
jgi:hypothetical protein